MKTTTLIIVLIISACELPVDTSVDYEDARRATITAWEEVVGPVSDRCYERSADAMVVESGYFPESCILEKNYVGCYIPTEPFGVGGDMIFLLDSRTDLQKQDTAVHEFIHLLSMCTSMVGDPFHLDDRLWDGFGPDTVEAHGCAGLRL
jgi:hypothetical protein